jgi:hypothetical protein
MKRTIQSVLVILAAVMPACIGQPSDEEAIDSPAGELQQQVNGFVSYANREIGLIGSSTSASSGFCTGTAVSPNVVLTAGHCISGANYFFTFQSQTATPQRYDVRDRWRSPNTDIGMLWLRQAVPWTRPIKQTGTVNSTAAVYGFGGNSCDTDGRGGWRFNDGTLVKRVAFFTTGANNVINSNLICGGDSGGPIIDWNDGIIFGVTVTSSGTQPGDTATFTPTNASTNWSDLQFVIFVWQATSNQGG